MTAWAGRALVAALAVLFALQLVNVKRNWAAITRVSTPRGSQAPDVTLPLLDGGTLHVAAERGHPLVLAFWASWCGPCMSELPGVERVAKVLRNAPHRARLYAVNTEGNRDGALEGKLRLGLTMPIALDDNSASQAYEVTTIPHTVILDADGHIAAVLRGVQSEDELMRAIVAVEEK
jgi:thiol-disulfide isomerase/thioredoxin